ncbi:MAG: carboxypeptidase regulatory-like domain-containing protein [Planctomycetota bacterium]
MTARVFGSVLGADTGKPITTAVVTAPSYSVTTTNGAYFFVTPGAATITVTASAPNYVSKSTKVTVVNSQQLQLNFTLNHV